MIYFEIRLLKFYKFYFLFLKKFEEMFRNMKDLDNKFDFLINKTEAYLQQITEFFQR